jgi:hypothetical protein
MLIDYIKLTERDLEVIIDICEEVIQYKSRALAKKNWLTFEEEYLPKLIDQIKENQWRIINHNNNTFVWIIDQICHSKRIVEGCRPKDGIDLADTNLGEQALEICRAASKGNQSYQSYLQGRQFRSLFD